jgi:hypothetical protein
MPKAGIEPARGKAPLDFESSASSSSATSARFMRGHGIGASLLDVGRGVIILRQAKERPSLACTTVPAREEVKRCLPGSAPREL